MQNHSRKQGPKDINEIAFRVSLEASVGESPETMRKKNLASPAIGHIGGKKGGPARAKKLSPSKRSEIARIAATARWKKTNI